MTLLIKSTLLVFFAILLSWAVFDNKNQKELLAANLDQEQTLLHYCGSTEANEQLFDSDSDLEKLHNQLEEAVYSYMANNAAKNLLPPNYTLPVVVHVVHENGPENISDAAIFQGIEYLNEAFANIGYYDQGTGLNTEIEFCMATRDPDGNPTNGITRDISPHTDVYVQESVLLKDVNRWNPTAYINIWIVREVCSLSIGCGVAGFAFLPSSHGSAIDGIVIEANWMGTSNANATVLIHEMGHYLGLYHTFKGGCNNGDCLTDGDKVCDTPPDQSTVAVPCNGNSNSCSSDVNPNDPNNPLTSDQNDMFWNYMDYGSLDCTSAFTAGQVARMNYYINGTRSSLISAPSCLPPCLSPIDASFLSSTNLVDIGMPVNFTNTSSGESMYDWQVDGLSISNAENPSYAFLGEGTYVVSLTITNSDPNCYDTFSDTIEVVCPVVADFDFPSANVPVNEIININNNSLNGIEYEWTLNGASQGNDLDFSLSLANPTVVSICLEVSGAFCDDIQCKLINIVAENDGDCDLTYYKNIGNNLFLEQSANVIVPSFDGGYFIAGDYGDRALIMKMSPNSELIWSRNIHFFPYECNISDLIEDADHNLIGIGSPDEGNSICFKYNPITNEVLWFKQLVFPVEMKLKKIKEKGQGENYIIVGENKPDNTQNNGWEGFIIEIDRDNGDIIWKKNYHLGSLESFNDIIIEDNSIFVIGHITEEDFLWGKRRGAMTRLDFSGNVLWSRLYITPVSEFDYAEITATNFLIDDDKMIHLSYGDTDFNSVDEVELHLYSTDLNGNIQWAKQYDIPEGHSERTTGLLNLDDGYLMFGDYSLSNNIRKTFLIKTDKQGQIEWSKSYGTEVGISQEANSIVLIGDFIYFVGGYGPPSNLDRILLTRIYKDGELSVSCDDINELEVETITILNPYDGNVDLASYYPSVVDYNFIIEVIGVTEPVFNDICGIPYCIEVCGNGIDDDSDGLVDEFDADCACLNSIGCGTPFYNHCTPECEYFLQISSFELEPIWTQSDVRESNQQVVADINGDCIPDIIAVNSFGNSISVLNSTTGFSMLNYADNLSSFTHLAAGDVDNDGMAEVFYIGTSINGVRLIRLDYKPSSNLLEETWQSSTAIAANGILNPANYAPSIADFDYNGLPEIYVGNQVFNGKNGLELANGGSGNQGTYSTTNNLMTATAIAVDILPDDACSTCRGLELVAGGTVYSVNLASYTNSGLNAIDIEKQYVEPVVGNQDGATRLVDFDRDGDLDVVITTQTGPSSGVQVFVWDVLTESLIGQVFYDLPNPTNQGVAPASIGDVDQDGWPEIIVSTKNNLTILDDYQNGGGVNWGSSLSTIKATIITDEQSGAAGTTLFDLNGDGSSEIFYRDEQNLKIYDGDLNILSTSPCLSFTGTTYPIIADINGDEETEVLCGCGNTGLTTFRTVGFPWIQSRKIWNQYNYFVTNIKDDGTIPEQQQNGHIVGDSIILNNSLMQQFFLDKEGTPFSPAPDAFLNIDSAYCNIDSVVVEITICNEGSDLLNENTPIAIYFGNPTNSVPILILSDSLGINLSPDSCININYAIPEAINEAIYIVVNDDGTSSFPYDLDTNFPITLIGECNFQNNIDSLIINTEMPPILDLGEDVVVCENGVFDFNAGAGFDYYEWHDGSQDSTYTSFSAGTFWVKAWNDCGVIQFDTVAVMIDSVSIIDLGLDTALCDYGSVQFSVNGFDDYQWFPNISIDCDTCSSVILSPIVSRTYTLVASTDAGCYSIDSVAIIIADTFYTEIDTVICDGIPVFFDGVELVANTSTLFNYSTVFGCDSTILVNVTSNGFLSYYEEIDTFACYGDFIEFGNILIPADSIHVFDYQTVDGCDSIIVLSVIPLDTFYSVENQSICDGESILIFGIPQSIAGNYGMTYNTIHGCDSTIIVELEVNEIPELIIEGEPTCQGDSTGSVSVSVIGGTEPFVYEWNTTVENIADLQGIPIGTYMVTVSDANDCSQTASITITDLIEVPIIGESVGVSCYGESDGLFQIDSSFSDYLFSLDGDIYQNTLIFTDLNGGPHDLYIQDLNTCEYMQSFLISEPPPLILDLPEDTTIQLGCSIQIESIVNRLDTLTYIWSPPIGLSCLDCPAPYATPYETTQYTLTVIDSDACSTQAKILIQIAKERNIFIPNVFSPNGDGYNDVFMVYGGKDVEEIRTFAVFDRWGEQIFEAKNSQPEDPTYGWNGQFKSKEMNLGVFVYWAEVVFVDGFVQMYRGSVTLIK